MSKRTAGSGLIIQSAKFNSVKLLLICESLPKDMTDYFFGNPDSMYNQNTILLFRQAGMQIDDISKLPEMGIDFTVAVKYVRPEQGFTAVEIIKHSYSLEEELAECKSLKVIMLMGDTAIKSLNIISKRLFGKNAVRKGSTYKIRKEPHYFGSIRAFPSYLHTGKNFLIEKSKQAMAGEDLKRALELCH